MKKAIVILPIIVCILLFCSCNTNNETSENTVYAIVNGEEVMNEEVEYFKSRMKADVLADYVEQYSVTDVSDFWESEFDGKTPAEELEERAFNEAVRSKIVLVLMRENGIYEDISFSALKAKAEAFNSKNADSDKQQVGLKTISLEQFYTYYITNGEMELKNILGDGELAPSDDEIKQEKALYDDELSDEAIKSIIVNKKYDEYIASLVEKADISEYRNLEAAK